MNSGTTYRIATRGSKLALWQANYVAALLSKLNCGSALNVIKTTGDVVQDRFLHEIGGKGLFVKELEQALLDNQADIAVHSLKDLPARLPQEFVLAAVLRRHVVYDSLILTDAAAERWGIKAGTTVGATELRLLQGSTLATSSLRRQSLLRGLNANIKLEPIRGNVDTRLAKLAAGQWDGIILAGASLERLGIDTVAAYPIATDWFVPCAAQGALAIEMTATHSLRDPIVQLDDHSTHRAVACERHVLTLLGGDCTMPFGCLVQEEGDTVVGRTVVLDNEGNESRVTLHRKASLKDLDSQEFAIDLVRHLLDLGGAKILEALKLQVPALS